jgi:hypothetical protein
MTARPGSVRRSVAACVLLCLTAAALARPPGDPSAPPPAAPPLVFASELIRLTVDGDTLRVEGMYRFDRRPTGATSTPLFYPFPRDSLLGAARMVSLAGRSPGGEWEPLPFRDHTPQVRGATWRIPLDGGDRYEVRAEYVQALLDDYGRYIVTTTRAWPLPLREARFEIVLPPGAEPVSFSFPFAREEAAEGVVYVHEAADFRPDRDIVFTWRR